MPDRVIIIKQGPKRRKSGRKPKRVQEGSGFLDTLKKINNFAKENKILSRASGIGAQLASYIPNATAQSISSGLKEFQSEAEKRGYGKRRRRN